MKNSESQPKQLILLNFNDLVSNEPLIFAPFQLFDKTVKSELETPVSETLPKKKAMQSLERI